MTQKGRLISVVTPTWQRHDLLLQRCIPSVEAQVYSPVEHMIVSDGPDPQLARKLATKPVQYFAVDHHEPQRHWGGPARRLGAAMAHGDLIAYLDDDDTWEPNHLSVLADALRTTPGPAFAWSRARVHRTDGTTVRIGDGPPAQGRIAGGSMLLIHREILDIADWAEPDLYEDWILIEKWIKAGIRCASVDAETVDYYPSHPINPAEAVYVSYPPTVREIM